MWAAIALQQELSKAYKLGSHLPKPQSPIMDNEDLPYRQPKFSLAQKLGLVKPPDVPLSENEWKQVEEAAAERNTFSEPCSICLEPLGLDDHYILNCSHVFHRVSVGSMSGGMMVWCR